MPSRQNTAGSSRRTAIAVAVGAVGAAGIFGSWLVRRLLGTAHDPGLDAPIGPEGELQEQLLRQAADRAGERRLALPESARVVVVNTPGIALPDEQRDPGKMRAGLDRALCALAGTDDPATAIKTLVSSDDRVAVKIPNTLDPVLMGAVVDALGRAAGPKGSISMFHVPAVDDWFVDEVRRDTDVERISDALADPPVSVGQFEMALAREIHDCTALVNVATLNTHAQMQLTGALKNHMGSVSEPHRLHSTFAHSCALLNDLPEIRDRTRLVILDAIRPSLQGHPDHPVRRHFWTREALIVSRDPVAADAVGLDLLREGRREHGLPNDFTFAGEQLAHAQELGLGIADPGRIERIDI